MKRSTLLSLATFGLALVILACRDVTGPFPFGRRTDVLPAGPLVVSPADMHGWAFADEPAPQYDPPLGLEEGPSPFDGCVHATACMINGPGTPPAGSGSAQLTTSGAIDGKALRLQAYAGTRLDAITELRYSTYRQSGDSGSQFAISLQLDVDYDLNDSQMHWPQGRLVFQPYQAAAGTWQSWDAKAGLWWGTVEDVFKGGMSMTNPCVETSPCTWAQLLAEFPNIGIANAGFSANTGAVVLKAGPGWMAFIGNVDALSIGVNGTTTTFDFEPQGSSSTVPLLPPDSLPSDLTDSTKWMSGDSYYNGTILREILIVRFHPGTSQTDRQAAIDLVQGAVAGGRRFSATDGLYLIRIPTDGTTDPLSQAVDALQALPQVSTAMVDEILLNAPSYRRPIDGAGEQKADWRLDAAAAFGNGGRKSWALEASNAPLAWGCAIGGTARIGVMDMGLHAAGDIVPNIDTTNTLPATTVFNHGTWVASVLAAKGNDQQNITGMMWDAKLDLRDVAALRQNGAIAVKNGEEVTSSDAIQEAVESMARRGDRVVNLSLGSRTPHSGGHTQAQDRARGAWGHVFKLAAAAATVRPLWVISAGNMGAGTDVYWESTTGIADSLPDETIIVTGAGTASGTLLPTKNGAAGATGTGAIDVAAPGEQVAVMDGTGVYQKDGSSFATPLVSGVAGLLFNFDSTLTAAEVRTFIKAAATASGRVAGTYPMLDAYGALKFAAQRPGAPLCGNRVYGNGTNLMVWRASNTAEALGSIGTFPPGNGWINVLHGGHRVNVYAWPNNYAFDYAVGGWTRTAVPDFPYTPAENSGTFNGQSSRTHDADTVLYARRTQNTVEVVTSDTVTYAQQVIGSLQLAVPPTFTGDCDFEGYSTTDGLYACRTYGYDRGSSGSYRNPSSVVSPIDGSLFMAIGYRTDIEVGGPAGWYTCGTIHAQLPSGGTQDFDNHCRDTRTYRQRLDSLRIYRVPKSTGVPVLLGTRFNEGPTRMAVSEDGRELLLMTELDTPTGNTWSWRTTGLFARTQTVNPSTVTCAAVAIVLVPTAQGPSLGTSTILAQETASRCESEGSLFNVPTIAPIRAANSGGVLRRRP